MSFRATFHPQAWVNDNAVDVDPEGPTAWDCTEFAAEHEEYVERRFDYDSQSANGQVFEVIDTEDVFQTDPGAPDWVQTWRGPFTIYIEKVAG